VEFFADRNLGRYTFPGLLREAGVTVHVHADHFRPDAPDTEWLPEAARRGWVVLSPDRHIMRNVLELDAVMLSGAVLLVLVGGSLRAADLARNFVNTLPRIEDFLASHPAPLVAKVYRPSPPSDIERGRPGSVKLAISRAEWERRRRSG
jgi:PIN like domain